MIDPNGNSQMVRIGNEYVIDSVTGVRLQYNNANFQQGDLDGWQPIGSEKLETGDGYAIAWKNSNTDEFMTWEVDNNGNYNSEENRFKINGDFIGDYELKFQQDLNQDGKVGHDPWLFTLSSKYISTYSNEGENSNSGFSNQFSTYKYALDEFNRPIIQKEV